MKTWKLAGEPERGCTLTPHLAGSALNALKARFLQRWWGEVVVRCSRRPHALDPAVLCASAYMPVPICKCLHASACKAPRPGR
mgnify:CR=1 FL=1